MFISLYKRVFQCKFYPLICFCVEYGCDLFICKISEKKKPWKALIYFIQTILCLKSVTLQKFCGSTIECYHKIY